MRPFFKRPMFAALIVLGVLFSGAAYAVVTRVFLHVDPDKSAPEIEQDVKQQLDNAGMTGTEVHAEKSDGKLKLEIKAENTGSSDVEIVPPEGGEQRSVRVAVKFDATPAQMEQVATAMQSPDVHAAVESDTPDAAAIKNALASHGLDADVTVDGGAVSVTITGTH